jgi:cellulose synthase/poly-beta-1,6-N-acetylglucosamine synthase-like glycosyltransferase
MSVLKTAFWASAGLLIYTQVGYGLVLSGLAAVTRRREDPATWEGELPKVSVIVAAYAEENVIAARVANLRALDYPADKVEVIVACDGSPDDTAARAQLAGADRVLELPRAGKIRAQDAAVAEAGGELLAFTDANSAWQPDALTRLVAPFADARVGYVCGDVRFIADGGDNQEGLYWRYEMHLRRLESALRSVTAGNGAIYATRAASYLIVRPMMGHDISFPFKMVKRGWRAVYAVDAHASEKMAPSIEGEYARKRRMASRTWPTVILGGMLSPRGYDPMYALMILSHRVLRYLSPFLHVIALGSAIALIGHGWVYLVAAVLQVLVLVAAVLAPFVPLRALLVARYYVVTTVSLATGLWDWLTGVQTAVWEPVEGTR